MVICYGSNRKLIHILVPEMGCFYNKYLKHCKQNFSRNTNIKVCRQELRGNEQHTVGSYTKGDRCYILAEILAELCHILIWKAGCVIGDLEFLSEQSFETIAWFLHVDYSQI